MNSETKGKTLIITVSIIGILLVSIVFYILFKPKPDYKAYATALGTYMSQYNNVVSFKANGNSGNIYSITVDNTWYNSSQVNKIKFCDAIRQAFTGYAWQYKVLSDKETAYVAFYDESGIKVAEPTINFGDYKILH